MIVYSETKQQFNNDVIMNQISDKILNQLRSKGLSGGAKSEYLSWQNSLMYMRNVLDDNEIPEEANIAIEYQIPRTSLRVDFIIAGADMQNRNNIVIIELKQWEKAEVIADEMLHSVKAFTGGANRIVSHPSYQAYSYATCIRNSSEQIQDEDIKIIPCAFLHNYNSRYVDALKYPIYKIWYDESPFFIKDQIIELRKFIKKYISMKSSDGKLLYKIDNGRIRPSKSLQDSLVSLMKGNKEFILLDDQVVVFDMCKKIMNQCKKDYKKRTIIIQGGPGTGKSVLAVNLLKEFIVKGLNTSYCTKNSAPRESYLRLLSKSDLKKEVNIKQLFRSPFGLSNCANNFYDCLIVDEAHRLVKQMYRDFNGVNQIKECINASLFTVFLIDESQRITTKDIGTVNEIANWAEKLGSSVTMNDSTMLTSQFRCNGSDQYIQFVNNLLQIGDAVDIDFSEFNFDFKVFSNPNELRDVLREKNQNTNKARITAGYCYDWNVKFKRGEFDIILEDGFKAKWNLDGDKIWAINPKSFEEIGCIHTSQGLEFDYIGVLIGKDLRFDPDTCNIITDKTMISKDDNSSGIRTAEDKIASQLIKNTYKTLLTRGQKGCYVYCEDKELEKHIISMISKKS